MIKKLIIATIAFTAILGGLYYYFLIETTSPQTDAYTLDIKQIRTLANSVEGSKPLSINAENVATLYFPGVMVYAGKSLSNHPMVMYSFQVMFNDGHALIDTSLNRELAEQMGVSFDFDDASFERMITAMESASLIVLTHEHPDHIGGLASHPTMAASNTSPSNLMKIARLTTEQINHPEKALPAVLSANSLKNYKALDYQTMHAIAPGIVLIKAAGHSPGSQMVFVQLSKDKEYLFVGDIAWHMNSITEIKPRPRLVSHFMLNEDRQAVHNQLFAISKLAKKEPGISIVVGHDGDRMAEYQKKELIGKHFQ